MAQFIFYAILIYFLYKFVFGFVIPVVIASRKVRKTMKDMREGMNPYQQQAGSTADAATEKSSTYTNTNKSASGKGDYIDFEEIK